MEKPVMSGPTEDGLFVHFKERADTRHSCSFLRGKSDAGRGTFERSKQNKPESDTAMRVPLSSSTQTTSRGAALGEKSKSAVSEVSCSSLPFSHTCTSSFPCLPSSSVGSASVDLPKGARVF